MKPMHLKEMPRKKRVLILVLSLVLLLGCALGGTYAWLYDRSGYKVVSLRGSDLEISLNETARTYQMVPGETLAKDPRIMVTAGSVKSYVFVRVEDINASNYLEYKINTTKMTEMEDKANGNYKYYYSIVEATTADVTINLLNPESVTIPTTVTKEMLNEVAGGTKEVQLNFSACAVQFANLDLDAAFEQATFN